MVVRSRTSARPPGRRTTRSSASDALETEMQTVPTGLASEPPPGPAMPVMPMPIVRAQPLPRAGRQRGRDLGRDRPVRLDQRSGHARQGGLGLVGVDDEPAEHVGRGAGEVGQAARHQAARAGLGGRDRRARQQPRDHDVDRRAVVGEQHVPVPRAQLRLEGRVLARKRRREHGRHLELPAPQAGRDLERHLADLAQRRRDLRLGKREEAQDPLLQLAGRREQLAQRRRRHRRRPTSSAARAAAPAARRRAARTTTRAAPARSRPAPAPRRPAARAPACARPPASPPLRRASAAATLGPRPRSAPPAPGRAPSEHPPSPRPRRRSGRPRSVRAHRWSPPGRGRRGSPGRCAGRRAGRPRRRCARRPRPAPAAPPTATARSRRG